MAKEKVKINVAGMNFALVTEDDPAYIEGLAKQLSKKIEDIVEANTNVSVATRQYNTYVEGLNNGTDSNLVVAMANAEQAREACEAAQKRYADYKESLNLGMDPTLAAADQAVKSAATAIQQAQSMQYEMEDKDYVTELQKEQAEDSVDSANLAYVQAVQRREYLARQSDYFRINKG